MRIKNRDYFNGLRFQESLQSLFNMFITLFSIGLMIYCALHLYHDWVIVWGVIAIISNIPPHLRVFGIIEKLSKVKGDEEC